MAFLRDAGVEFQENVVHKLLPTCLVNPHEVLCKRLDLSPDKVATDAYP